jgi:hypothetical protein
VVAAAAVKVAVPQVRQQHHVVKPGLVDRHRQQARRLRAAVAGNEAGNEELRIDPLGMPSP